MTEAEVRRILVDVDNFSYQLEQFCRQAKITKGQRKRLEQIARHHRYLSRRIRRDLCAGVQTGLQSND